MLGGNRNSRRVENKGGISLQQSPNLSAGLQQFQKYVLKDFEFLLSVQSV